MKTARASGLALALGWSCIAGAQVAVPPLTGWVVDQTGTLNAGQTAALEQTLQAFETRKGSQVAVLIVPTAAPETIEQYALRVAEIWKLGRKKVDDGAVLVIAMTDRALRIEVGYGLEGALTDATSKRIISEVMTPRFRKGDFYGGITAGVDEIIRIIDGEPLPAPAGGVAGIQQYVPVIFILAFVVGGVLRAALGRLPGALATGGVVTVVAWIFFGAFTIALVAGVVALLFTLFSGGGGPGIGGIGGRRGGFGTGGMRSGGPFGGGTFGGGGASGRW